MALTSEQAKKMAAKSVAKRQKNAVVKTGQRIKKYGKSPQEKLHELNTEKIEYKGRKVERLQAAMLSVLDKIIDTGDANALMKIMNAGNMGRMRENQPDIYAAIESAQAVNALKADQNKYLNAKAQTIQLKNIAGAMERGKSPEEAQLEIAMDTLQGNIAQVADGDADAVEAMETKAAIAQSNKETKAANREVAESAGKVLADDTIARMRANETSEEMPDDETEPVTMEQLRQAGVPNPEKLAQDITDKANQRIKKRMDAGETDTEKIQAEETEAAKAEFRNEVLKAMANSPIPTGTPKNREAERIKQQIKQQRGPRSQKPKRKK